MIYQKLSQLVPEAKWDENVTGLKYDSRQVQRGDLFFAIPGFKEDGTAYLTSAFAAGAVAAIVSDTAKIPADLQAKCFPVANIRQSMADIAYQFYEKAATGLTMYGVTGTKGKTSTVYLLESVLKTMGRKTALLGTVECRHPKASYPAKRTTLDSIDLQQFLWEAKLNGADTAAMEVSAHALSLERVRNCRYKGAIFTNLTPDHLDFYKDMEDYFSAKLKLFQAPYFSADSIASVNEECAFGKRLLAMGNKNFVSFGVDKGDVRAEKTELSTKGIRFSLKTPDSSGDFFLESALVGDFNLKNILGVCALAWKMGCSKEMIKIGIEALTHLPGRLEEVKTKMPFSVFVDFAHMGPALENVLVTLRKSCKGKLIVVFGAGGDKDPQRRIQLGQVAANRADFSVITTDNPRSEDPAKIIAAIEKSYLETRPKKDGYLVQPDRKQAIRIALEMAREGDIVCLAGKGHETGQTVGNQIFPFDDREEARIVLAELEAKNTNRK